MVAPEKLNLKKHGEFEMDLVEFMCPCCGENTIIEYWGNDCYAEDGDTKINPYDLRICQKCQNQIVKYIYFRTHGPLLYISYPKAEEVAAQSIYLSYEHLLDTALLLEN